MGLFIVTPTARIQTVIELIDEVLATERPADGVLSAYFRARRFIGAKDRREISNQIWRILRYRARLTWALGTEAPTGRLLVAANLICGESKSIDSISGLFSGAKNGPLPLSVNEKRMVLRAKNQNTDVAPRSVKFECPEWILKKIDVDFGDEADKEISAFVDEAGLDLRVNTLKATRDEVLKSLNSEGLDALPTSLSPIGITLPDRIAIGAHAGFQGGLFEVQDQASQICAQLVEAQPGQAVIDICAGAGGKTLAIAGSMVNKGRLVACDISVGRLKRNKKRLRRAGVHNATLRIIEEHDKWLKRQAGVFDRVLVDAPCSGTGAWRRNPDARWHFSPESLENIIATQDGLMDRAAALVKPSARLIYATCSILAEENTARAEAFLARNSNFRAHPVNKIWPRIFSSPYPQIVTPDSPFLTLTPARHGTDGFFVAIFDRVS